MNFRRKAFLLTVFIGFLAVMLSGGCGGGGGSNGDTTAEVKAYIDGDLHGELSKALLDYLDEAPYNDKSTDRLLIISRADKSEIDEETLTGAAATLEAGQPVAIEHATEAEINSFLGSLGLEENYKAESADLPAELFAIQKLDGKTAYFVSLNDDTGYSTSEDTVEETFTIIGEENSETSKVVSTDKTVSMDTPEQVEESKVQGLRVQNFITWVKTEKENTVKKSTLRKGSGDDDLSRLASATVWNKDLSSKGQTFTVRYTIYSCHSFVQNKDYFLISQSAQLNPSLLWKRTQEGHVKYPTIYETKVEGYMRRYLFKNYFAEDPGEAVPLISSSPENVNDVSTVTSGFTWEASGNIGFSGLSATGGLSGGVSYSTTESFNVSDCNVDNKSGSEQKKHMTGWEYTFRNPPDGSRHFYWTDLKDAPLLSRSNFQPVNKWIWCLPRAFTEKTTPLYFKSEFTWTNGQSEGAVNCLWIEHRAAKHKDWLFRYVGFWVPLGKPPVLVLSKGQMDFSKSGESKALELVSAKDWSAESSQSWCEVQEKSGVSTGGDRISLHISVAPNDTEANREAVVTLKSNDGKEEAKLKVFQSKY